MSAAAFESSQIIGDKSAFSGTMAASEPGRNKSGFFCSTSGTVLTDRESLSEHYKSDFHRYNLKRKVAGLPPVTKEWFEARKAQLANAQSRGALTSVPSGHIRIWIDPLTRKTFRSAQTYNVHVQSKKYQELVQKSGQPAPAPIVTHKPAAEVPKRGEDQGEEPQPQPVGSQAVGYKVVMPSGGLPLRKKAAEDVEGDGDESGWETASDEEAEEAEGEDGVGPLASEAAGQQGAGRDGAEEEGEQWEEWDVRRSLFDGHVSRSFDENLEYMWHNFGFYFPDSQYLKDPEGLLKYLGAKLRYGLVPLYSPGDAVNAKQFRSLHAVQRHMVDSGRCKMAYDDNEDEYADFYEYDDGGGDEGRHSCKELVTSGGAPDAELVSGGFEMYLPSSTNGGGGKIIGSRDLARYYRQRPRPVDERRSVVVNSVLARYRALGIALRDEANSLEVKKQKAKSRRDFRFEGRHQQAVFMRSNINKALPKNCPH